MIKLRTLINETKTDEVIEKFISLLPKYDLEFHSWNTSEKGAALEWRGNTYPTITDKNRLVKVALDNTDIFNHNGHVWVGDPTRPILHGFVIQAIVTDPQHRGKGLASDILRRMLSAADEAKLKLKLEPIPMDSFINKKKKEKGLTKKELINWYIRRGFIKDPEANIMTRNPLSEMEYPLAKKDDQQTYAGYEGWKGKLIWMTPDRFLELANPLPDYQINQESLKNLIRRMKEQLPTDFLMLEINGKTKKVIGHEGRHRAMASKKVGIEKVPVLIIVRMWDERVPKWTKQQHSFVDKAEFKPQWSKI